MLTADRLSNSTLACLLTLLLFYLFFLISTITVLYGPHHSNNMIPCSPFPTCASFVGMPFVFVIICIPLLFVYFLALPSLLPSAINIIVFGDFQILDSRHHDLIHRWAIILYTCTVLYAFCSIAMHVTVMAVANPAYKTRYQGI